MPSRPLPFFLPDSYFCLMEVIVIFSNKKSPIFQVSPKGMDDCNGYGSRMPVKLRTFVELTMDVASASPRRYFFEAGCCMYNFPFILSF